MAKLSRHNLFVETSSGVVQALNLLSRAALALPRDALKFIEALPGRKLDDLTEDERTLLQVLRDNLFVLPDGFDELEYIRRRHAQEKFSDAVLALVVAPTLGCNLGCHYCFEDKRPERLAPGHLDALQAWVERDLRNYRALHVQWFGGEPLLAMDTIRNLSRYLRTVAEEQGKPYGAEIITNGVNLTPDIASELVELGVTRAQVTFEGAKRLHDRVRFEAGHAGSYDRIIDNLCKAPEGLETTIRIHVAPYSVESARALLDDLAAAGLASRVARIYFAPIFNYKSSDPARAFAADARRFLSSEGFASVQIELMRRAAELGFAQPDMLDASYGLCTAVGAGTRVVNPDGTLTKCYMDVGATSEAVGDVFTGLVKGPNLERWMTYDFSRDADCKNCTFAPVCMGGCPKQEMAGADKSVICTPLRYNFADRIRLQFDSQRTVPSQP